MLHGAIIVLCHLRTGVLKSMYQHSCARLHQDFLNFLFIFVRIFRRCCFWSLLFFCFFFFCPDRQTGSYHLWPHKSTSSEAIHVKGRRCHCANANTPTHLHTQTSTLIQKWAHNGVVVSWHVVKCKATNRNKVTYFQIFFRLCKHCNRT